MIPTLLLCAAALASEMAVTVDDFRDLARRKTGRDVAHVLLLHANALAADHLGLVLDTLAADGWTFVPLEDALADPVYALPDTYAGANGISWLLRIDPALPGQSDWLDEADAALMAKYPKKKTP